MTKPFDPSKPCQTRDGRKARILATDLEGNYPIAAQIQHQNGYYQLASFRADGTTQNSLRSDIDLINTPTKRKGWVAVFADNFNPGQRITSHTVFDSPVDCAENTGPTNRIAIAPIEWEE